MDAMIRFCFETKGEDIQEIEEYAKTYAQAKFMVDHTNIMQAKKSLGV